MGGKCRADLTRGREIEMIFRKKVMAGRSPRSSSHHLLFEGAEKEAEGVGVPGMHVPQADG